MYVTWASGWSTPEASRTTPVRNWPFAAERALTALVLLGVDGDELARRVERAEAHGRWLAGRH